MKKVSTNPSSAVSRRGFMRGVGAASLSATPWVMNLAAMGAMADAAAYTVGPNDPPYRALVCLFMAGGNDNGNTLVPYDPASYASYALQRGTLTIPQSNLIPLAPTTPIPTGQQYALPTTMAPLANLFHQTNSPLAILLNVGALIQPTTLAQYQAGSVQLPPSLFSHNDQQRYWHSISSLGGSTGWGGRLADEGRLNNQPTANQLFSAITVTGNSLYLSGAGGAAYKIDPVGAVPILARSAANFYNSSASVDALNALIQAPQTHAIADAYVNTTKRSIEAESTITTALANAPSNAVINAWDPGDNELAKQLKMVARLIAARNGLGMKRQVFMVGVSGYDLHDFLLDKHPILMTQLSGAMSQFYAATQSLGLGQDVTTFTASDFGRTMVNNSDGSDHGWGSHHFILGGSVNGGRYFGTAPGIEPGHPNDVGQGRLLPSTSVNQYATTLSSWLGVPQDRLSSVAPNIVNWPDTNSWNLGFML